MKQYIFVDLYNKLKSDFYYGKSIRLENQFWVIDGYVEQKKFNANRWLLKEIKTY